jgi:endo-1,4-beta-xylanase
LDFRSFYSNNLSFIFKNEFVMKKTTGLWVLFSSICFSIVLMGSGELLAQKTLKDAYKDYFPIGVAVAPRNLSGPEADLIIRQFSSVTAENAMKMGPIHPEPDRYAWQDPDAIVAFAQKNGMKVRGHTLCWHNQTPGWIFTDSEGKPVSREVLLERLKQHINDVVGRYKGKIYAWDVVNEAVPDTGTSIYRKSRFYEIIGEDYIEKAFEYAHAADPAAKLFYNDYNTESAAKREKIFQLLKKLKEKNVPVHGVGLQGHWSIYEPTAAELEESIRRFASLGLEVQITELDVSVHSKEHERRQRRSSDTGGLTPEMIAKQTAQYKMLFDVFRKYRQNLTSVTFWNVSDKSSWLDNFPVPGRKDYPLLFDQNYEPKEAFEEVVGFE